jgi:hypothetical protein
MAQFSQTHKMALGNPIELRPHAQATLNEQTIRINLSPFHPNIATCGKLSFQIHVPYSDSEVTILTNPNLLDYQENTGRDGAQFRQVQLSVPTMQSRTLKFRRGDDQPQTVRIDDTDYDIQLLKIGKEKTGTQDFFFFEFRIVERFILPPKLYKYRAVNDYSLRILTDDELYYGNYRMLNDPFELAFEIEIAYRPDSKKITPQFIERAKKPIKANIESCIQANLGLLSLTERNDDILMWSHYSESHTGFCLEFNSSIFDPELLKQVTYTDDVYKVQCRVDDNEQGIIVPDDTDEYLIGICNTKKTDWQYEKEWRDVRKQSGAYKFDPSGLTGLIFGYKIPDEKKERLFNALAERRRRLGGVSSVHIYEARLRTGQYGLDIIDSGQAL